MHKTLAFFGVLTIFLIVFGLSGCAGAKAPQTFTIKAAPQLTAQADLATTTHAVARKVEASGTVAHSDEGTFLVDATGIWKNQTGPGRVLEPTAAMLAAAEKKIADAKRDAELKAEAERQEHMAQLAARDKQIAELATALDSAKKESAEAVAALKVELETLRASRATKEMWAKLWAIALVGVVATAAASWFTLTRKSAPLVAIGFAGLAGVVVVRACSGDITVVLILAVVLAAAYALGMWAWTNRKFLIADKVATAQEKAIQELPPEIAPSVKKAVAAEAGKAGVEPELNARLVGKGFADPN